MNFRARRRRSAEATLEITPLIDVIFLLLLFFLITSTFSRSRESSIPIDLPEAQSGSVSAEGVPVVLNVDDEGDVVVDGAELQGDTLYEKLVNLHQTKPDAQILLRGDRRASHGRMIEVLDVVKQIGFDRVDLVISKSEP